MRYFCPILKLQGCKINNSNQYRSINSSSKKLYIYKIYAHGDGGDILSKIGWDVNIDAVIIAENEKECRKIAYKKMKGDETSEDGHPTFWLDEKYSKCDKIGISYEDKPGIVTISFQSG